MNVDCRRRGRRRSQGRLSRIKRGRRCGDRAGEGKTEETELRSAGELFKKREKKKVRL